MNKKYIIVSFAILILAVLGGAYWYYSKSDTPLTSLDLFPGESGLRSNEPTSSTNSPSGDEITTPEQQVVPLSRLYELHKAPVVGVGIIEERDKKGVITSVSARYVERGVGHIFEAPLSPIGLESRISNETRTRLSEALWGNSGKSVVLRYVDDKSDGFIATRVVNITKPTEPFNQGDSTDVSEMSLFKTEEVYLPEGIPFMSVSEDGGDKLFYLLGESGTTASFKNTGILKIFSSPFTEWLPQFPNQRLVTLTTKPSAKVPGYLFFLNTQNKSVTKILSGINGLTTLTSRDGKLVLFSETKGGPELSLYNVAKKERISLYIQTLPEKCVWGKKRSTIAYCAVPQSIPQGYYPDQWYQGLVSFSDELWEIDSTTSIGRKIMDTKSMGAPTLDMTNLTVSSDDTYLVFMNKVTGTPWTYRLTEDIPSVKTAFTPTQNGPLSSSIVEPPLSASITTLPQSVIDSEMKRLR